MQAWIWYHLLSLFGRFAAYCHQYYFSMILAIAICDEQRAA
jgi:hypothetical protein